MSSFIFYLRVAATFLWCVVASLALLVVSFIPGCRYRTNALFVDPVCTTARKLLGIKLEIRNAARLTSSRPCIFIPNHQHLIDFFVIGGLMPPKTVTVGKRSILWVPIFGWLFARAGHLFIERGENAKALETMREAKRQVLAGGLSVIVCPEGTRSHGRGLLPFKKGAFYLAMETGLDLQPVAISSFGAQVDFRLRHAGKILVDLLEPIPVTGLTKKTMPDFIAKVHAQLGAAIAGLDAELA